MRRIARAIGWIGVVALVASLVWLAGAIATERAIEAGMAELRARGWQIDVDPADTHGFPDSFETELTGLRAIAPTRDVIWQTDSVELTHALLGLGQIAALADAGSELLILPYRLRASEAEADIAVRPWPPLPVRRAGLDLRALSLRSALGGHVVLDHAVIDVNAEGATVYALNADFTGVVMPDLSAPPADSISLRAALDFDTPWNAFGDPPRLNAIEVTAARMTWGAARLEASGQLSVADNGRIEGRLLIDLDGWEAALAQSTAAGFITPQAEGRLAIQARILAELSTGGDRLTAPLVIENGRMFLGPFPLGPAPRLY